MPPLGVELKHALGNGPMTVADLETLFLRMGLATLLAACVSYRVWRPLMVAFDATTKSRSKRTLVAINAESPALIWPQIAKLFKNTRVAEMSNRVAELGKDSGKLVIELDLRGNMDAATIREVLEANQVQGVYRVAPAE